MVYDPTDVFLPAATVKNTCAVPPEDSMTLVELSLTVGVCGVVGVIEAEMLIVPVNPELAIVRVELPIEELVVPLRIVRLFGIAETEIACEGTIKVMIAICVRDPLVAVTPIV